MKFWFSTFVLSVKLAILLYYTVGSTSMFVYQNF